jgi:hypothetical protein
MKKIIAFAFFLLCFLLYQELGRLILWIYVAKQ